MVLYDKVSRKEYQNICIHSDWKIYIDDIKDKWCSHCGKLLFSQRNRFLKTLHQEEKRIIIKIHKVKELINLYKH